MPRNRAPLDYPLNRVVLRVGLALATWLPWDRPRASPAERAASERELADYLGLPAAVEQELLAGYRFYWSRAGQVEAIQLLPHERARRTPGFYSLRRWLLPPRPRSRRKE